MNKIYNIIKLRLPEIQLLAVVSTQLKFYIVKYHDEPTILLFEALFCMWEQSYSLRLCWDKHWF
jgi:hypothetical protein